MKVLAHLTAIPFFSTFFSTTPPPPHPQPQWDGATVPSKGCYNHNSPPLHPGNPTEEFTIHSPSGGGDRSFLIHRPDSYATTSAAPLILVFHGKDQTAAEIEAQSQFSEPYFNPDAIVVYPQGINNQWTGDPASPPLSITNDLAFTSTLLAHLTATYCISTAHIYAAGFSNGGGLTSLLACNATFTGALPALSLAGIALASAAVYKDAALPEPLFSICTPGRSPVPILAFHGTADPIIHYDDGATTPDGPTYPVPAWLAAWAARNACPRDARPALTERYAGAVLQETWTCATTPAPAEPELKRDVVTHYLIRGFGHGWPSTRRQDDDVGQRFGPTVFNATGVMMDFFRAWSTPSPPRGPRTVRMGKEEGEGEGEGDGDGEKGGGERSWQSEL
ncbi:hypothetical protein MMC19_001114 [Ptychographa xylographoides]|nr:hypothetical protein [Ptychographa xylographoides]